MPTGKPFQSEETSHTEFMPAAKSGEEFLVANDHIIPSQMGYNKKPGRAFPGKVGAFHAFSKVEVQLEARVHHFLHELSFDEISELSYMFNYTDMSPYILGNRKVKIQLDDSKWSRSFSLSNVGVNQNISINHPTKGCLEVGFRIILAPGRLAKYTKIVRFLPHFTIMNKLKANLKVFQSTGFANHMMEVDVLRENIRPYHLPSMYGERKIGLEIDGSWNKSALFPIDHIGSFCLSVRRKIDVALIQHVKTRGNAEYDVEFPDGLKSLGIWFETDAEEDQIIVKRLQPGSYAMTATEIQIGDVLVSVNNQNCLGKNFDTVMEQIKAAFASNGERIFKFRTVEEKIRIIRGKNLLAKKIEKRPNVPIPSANISSNDGSDDQDYQSESRDPRESKVIRVSLRQVECSVAITVSDVTADATADYRIENKSICYVLYYKQRGIMGTRWTALQPGQTVPYAWEDPFNHHQLWLVVGGNIVNPLNPSDSLLDTERREEYCDNLSLSGIEQRQVVIDFDGVKYHFDEREKFPYYYLPIPASDSKLVCHVRSSGGLKIMEITPCVDWTDALPDIKYSYAFCKEQTAVVANFQKNIVECIGRFRSMESVSQGALDNQFLEAHFNFIKEKHNSAIQELKEKQTELLQLHSPTVSIQPFTTITDSLMTNLNGLFVHILEARELSPAIVGKVEDVYCKAYIHSTQSSLPTL